MILPADKGSATVIINTNDYISKMLDLVQDKSTYTVLNHDPTLKVELYLEKLLADMLQEHIYYLLLCHNGSAPALCFLLKIHKSGTLMLPIVDFTRSPLCKLSSYLYHVCAQLVGSGPTFIHNSQDFIDKVHPLTVNDNEVMVSFDVVSLFTYVSAALAVDACKAALLADAKLCERMATEVQGLA